MPDIRTLVSSEIHEPKHISDSDAADAGKVITPLGSGTSELRNLTPEEVGIQFIYAELGVDANTVTFPISAASDGQLYDPADYLNINSLRVPGASVDESAGMSVDLTNYTVTIPTTGVYRTEGWFNIESDTANSLVGVRFTLNGTPASSVIKTDIVGANRTQNISGTSIAALTAGDEIGFAVASDKSADITLRDFKTTVSLVRAM